MQSAAPEPLPADLDALGDERYVSCTTFRATGIGVATPVWIARDGTALVFVTDAGSGKVKRLRRDPRVDLQACDARGGVDPAEPVVRAHAEVVAGGLDHASGVAAIATKYGVQSSAIRLINRLRRRADDRVVIRITAARPDEQPPAV